MFPAAFLKIVMKKIKIDTNDFMIIWPIDKTLVCMNNDG